MINILTKSYNQHIDGLQNMIKQNIDFSTAFHAFQMIDAQIREFALEHSEFKEKIPSEQGEFRRPVVCVRSHEFSKKVNNLLKRWMDARDQLHEIEPHRFPLNAAIFNPVPQLISNVKHAQLYINTATNSRIIPSEKILGRLSRMRRSYSSKKESSIYDETLSSIEKDIEFFTEHKDEDFRLRSTGYTEVILVVTNDIEEYKFKVPDIGVFIESDNNSFSLLQPDQSPQAGIRSKRFSIYDDLMPIQTVLPLTGELFSENEIVKARTEEERRKKINEYK